MTTRITNKSEEINWTPAIIAILLGVSGACYYMYRTERKRTSVAQVLLGANKNMELAKALGNFSKAEINTLYHYYQLRSYGINITDPELKVNYELLKNKYSLP